jgi:hypothetical protein
MKNHAMTILGCILMLLTLFGCGSEIPPELVDVTMDGNLEVAEDFYVRNKPEPVVVEYNVELTDTSGTVGEMIIGVKIDLFRFDAVTGDFVFERTLAEDPSLTVMCNETYLGSTNWVYDRQATATTYKIILEATMDEDSFSVASDLFVIWKSKGAPRGHAKRDLKKMDQVEKLITRLDGYYGIYQAAKLGGYIVGDELVVIHEETMTVEEAVAMAEAFEMNAIEKSDQAMAYFDAQDYETCFILAKKAAREVHSALTIYHALLAQARDMCDSN